MRGVLCVSGAAKRTRPDTFQIPTIRTVRARAEASPVDLANYVESIINKESMRRRVTLGDAKLRYRKSFREQAYLGLHKHGHDSRIKRDKMPRGAETDVQFSRAWKMLTIGHNTSIHARRQKQTATA